MARNDDRRSIRCSFCGKPQSLVDRMIAGNNCYICDDCVRMCASIVGEEERLSGTVISDTVNLSSRLESLTKTYKTAMLISKDTLDHMKSSDALDLRYLGMVQVAGVNEVRSLYEVLDCLPDGERQLRSAAKGEFREALRLFHMGERGKAIERLQALATDGKGDHITHMYLKYMQELSKDDKSKVFVFVRK